jgi:hypothetical protein
VIPAITNSYQWPDFSVIPQYHITKRYGPINVIAHDFIQIFYQNTPFPMQTRVNRSAILTDIQVRGKYRVKGDCRLQTMQRSAILEQ